MEDRNDNGVVVTTKEIYSLLLKVDKQVTILSENVNELKKLQPVFDKKYELYDVELDTLNANMNGVKTHIKAIWTIITLILSGLIATAYKIFEGGLK